MKKKYYAGIMMVAVSMAVTACGGGSKSPKSEVAEISAELEQQMNADDKAAIKEAQAELKEEGRSNLPRILLSDFRLKQRKNLIRFR